MPKASAVLPASSATIPSKAEGPFKLVHPAPRYPKVPDITEVEQLLPYARHIAQRPMPYTGDQRPGYGVKGGERILFVTDSDVDPLVVEAFLRVLRYENKCRVDVFEQQSQRKVYRTGQVMRVLVDSKPAPWMLGGPEWTQQVVKKEGYDKVIGQIFWEENNLRLRCHNFSMDWPTREQLASPAVMYPEEIIEALDRTAWQILLQAETSRITDPQGTDITFTWLPEYWQIMDGSYPNYPTEGFGTHRYHHGALKNPLISSHLCGYPLGIVLPKSNVCGVVAGTADHLGPYAHIRIYLEQNKVTRMEGGGEFGEKWREFIDRNKKVKFPHYPGSGVDWFVEAAIGTHPKISRPFNVLDSATARSTFMAERDRSGIMHLGIGQILDFAWALRQNPPLPFYHFHVHLDFCTYSCKLRDGSEVKLVDKGHLTALDDPGVRTVASKYGDPDELLREDWIPAIPGINVVGDYWKDYAPDPETYIMLEHRAAYAEAIERSKKYYK